MAILLALLSAALGGCASFFGGTLSRALPVRFVILASQAVALVLAAVVAATGGADLSWPVVGWGLAAGAMMLTGLLSFYTALATGTMGVVAPVAALGVVVPLAWGIACGERPATGQLMGLALAVLGVVGASGPEFDAYAGKRSVAFAALAAAGFGAAAVCFASGSNSDLGAALLVTKATIVGVLCRWAGDFGTVRPERRHLLGIGLIAVADTGAVLCLGYAARLGPVGIVGPLASLYPVGVVILGRAVHGERLMPVQYLGIAAAISGVAVVGLG